MKKILFCLLILTACEQRPAPQVEILGDKATGYTITIKHPNGKDFFKWSDLASDTTAMRKQALTWYKAQK